MKLGLVTLWILLGAALTGGAYWTFLITPESTIWSLAASALLLASAAFLLALTLSGAIAGWRHGITIRHARTALRGVPAFVPAALIVGVVWWLVGNATNRVTMASGPINAWFIARFGWDDVSWLFTGINWLAAWLTWLVAPSLALALMSGIIAAGWRTLTRRWWIAYALSPVRLGLATVLVAALVAAPWMYLVPWRPEGLPDTSLQLAFIIGKLTLSAVLMAVGVALVIRLLAADELDASFDEVTASPSPATSIFDGPIDPRL